jgi:hypothetical protein
MRIHPNIDLQENRQNFQKKMAQKFIKYVMTLTFNCNKIAKIFAENWSKLPM